LWAKYWFLRNFSFFCFGLDKNCIRAKFQEIAKPETTISRSKFAKILHLTEELAQPIFDFIDMMDNNEVDDYEWTCAWAAFVRADLEDRLKGIYALFDNDGSNVLERTELLALMKAILMADSQGKKVPTDSDAQAKIDQIWKDYLIHGETLHVCEFENIAVSDSQIRNGLVNMSVIRDGEVCESDEVFDVDIDEEIYLATDYEHDAEYQARKNGVESRNAGTDDQGGLFMEAQNKRDAREHDEGSHEHKVE
jgi:Ca2+-binding EF-hand superfamily protein